MKVKLSKTTKELKTHTFLINDRHWIHLGQPTFTSSYLFLTAIDLGKDSEKFFNMNKSMLKI